MERKKEYVIIAGCGRLGACIAEKLSEQRQDVMVLDADKNAFRRLPASYGGLTMGASATDIEKIKEAEGDKATTFIAVTDNDCVNICAAQMAKTVFRIPKVVARLYDQERAPLLKEMGINTICPSELSEKEVSNYIDIGGVQNVW